jgi:hypothetical protein
MNAQSEIPVKHRLVITFDQEPSAAERDEVLNHVRNLLDRNFEPISVAIEERTGSWILDILMLVAPWVGLQTASYFYKKGLDHTLAKGSKVLRSASPEVPMEAEVASMNIAQRIDAATPPLQVNSAMRMVDMLEDLKSRRVRSITLLAPVGEFIGAIHATRDAHEDVHVTAVLCNTEREAGDYLGKLQK